MIFDEIDRLIPDTLQQYLPFTVLKPIVNTYTLSSRRTVATVLTVYGIETFGLDDYHPH